MPPEGMKGDFGPASAFGPIVALPHVLQILRSPKRTGGPFKSVFCLSGELRGNSGKGLLVPILVEKKSALAAEVRSASNDPFSG